MAASRAAHPEMVKQLLAAGADPNAVNVDGWTALMAAAEGGSAETVESAHATRAQTSTPASNDGWTALMGAADAGKTDLVRLLLAKGANPRLTNNDNFTAAAYAERNGHDRCTSQAFWMSQQGRMDMITNPQSADGPRSVQSQDKDSAGKPMRIDVVNTDGITVVRPAGERLDIEVAADFRAMLLSLDRTGPAPARRRSGRRAVSSIVPAWAHSSQRSRHSSAPITAATCGSRVCRRRSCRCSRSSGSIECSRRMRRSNRRCRAFSEDP